MIEIRPKVDPISTEGLMMYFAECLKNFCKQKQGTRGCKECCFFREGYGCQISDFEPEKWRIKNE